MQKWIMSILLSAACILGVTALLIEAGKHESGQAEQPSDTLTTTVLDEAAAQTVYKQSCLACHGDQLEGKIGPNLQKAGAKLSVQQIYKKIQNGGGSMPGFKSSLKDEQIANLALWLAQHK